MFGWQEQEALGKPIPTVAATEGPALRSALEHQLHQSASQAFEIRQIPRNGAVLDVRVHFAPLLGEDGNVRAMLLVLADITTQRLVEEDYFAGDFQRESG